LRDILSCSEQVIVVVGLERVLLEAV